MWPFKPRKEIPEEKRESGDRRKPNLLVRIVRATFRFVFVTVIWDTVRFVGRLIKRFLITLGVIVLLIAGVYFFAEDIIMGVDQWKPEFFDAQLGTKRSDIAKLHDDNYYAEQSEIVSADNKSLTCISSPEHRVKFDDPSDVSKLVRNALIASEDKTFLTNPGVDKDAILRALFWRALGESSSGASTPTMQIAKNVRGGTGKRATWKEKIGDAIMALRIEKEFNKEQLLLKYANMPYLGRGRYGIEAASYAYFGKPSKELQLHQVAFIVSLINKPALPDRSFARDRTIKLPLEVTNTNWQEVLRGTRRVLEQMSKNGFITPIEDARAADTIDKSLRSEVLARAIPCGASDYYFEKVRQEAIKLGFNVAKDGLMVPIPRDEGLQKAMERAVLDLTPNTYRLRHKDAPDIGELRAGGVAIQFNGDVLAEVGNIDWKTLKFDAMAKSFRSPGSTFKPFVYGALNNKLVEEVLAGENPPQTTDDIAAEVMKRCTVLDAPVAVGMGRGRGKKWIQNFHQNSQPLYRGKISCALAIAESRNAPAMRAGAWAGIKDVLTFLHDRLGMPRDAKHVCLPYPTTAIGACDMNPLAMSVAASFPNGGFRVTPHFYYDICKDGRSLIRKEENGLASDCDMKGEHRPPPERVMHPATSLATTQMLRGPVDIATGTVHSLRAGVIPGMDPLANIWQLSKEDRAALEKKRIAFPIETSGEIAGKTGTATNADGRTSDVWELIFIPGPDANPEKGIMLIFWMGKDSKDHPLGERGTNGGAINGAETGGRNWTHSAATVLKFLQEKRGYLQPGFKFQPMVKDEVYMGLLPKGTEPIQEIIPDPDEAQLIDPSDPNTPPELLKDLPPEEPEAPPPAASAPLGEGGQKPDDPVD